MNMSKNQTQINKDNIRKNKIQVDHGYKVGDKVILNNHAANKYETPHKEPFVITRCFNNGRGNLQCGPKHFRYNIRQNKPYKYDTNVEEFNQENIYDEVNI